MLAKLLLRAEEHSLFSMVILHVLTATCLIAMVSGIAFAGGIMIWMFYKCIGIM